MAASRSGNRAIVEQLLADGATHVFGNPGTVEQGLLDEIEREARLSYVLALHEGVAVGIADAYARATRRPAFVQLHSGVGLGNGVGMLYQSMRGRTPLVVLVGEAGLSYDAMDAHMAADLVAIARPVTKWAGRVVDRGSVLRLLRRAVKVACTPPQGPVLLALPLDVLDQETTEEVHPSVQLDLRSAPSLDAVQVVARKLVSAARPLVIIGDGIALSQAQPELARAAELSGAEVWSAQSSTVNLDTLHPLFCGSLGRMFGEDSRSKIERADVVLIVGTYVFPEVFPARTGVFAPDAWVAHFDLVPDDIAKSFPVDLGLVADPKLALAMLAEQIAVLQTPQQRIAIEGRIQACQNRKLASLAAQREADAKLRDDVPMKPARFMQELAERWRDEFVVFDEALTCAPYLHRYLPPRSAERYFQTYSTCLGVGLPGAVGLQLAFPDKTVIGFTGDGGAAQTIQALWTALRLNLNVKFVVCNNQCYNVLRLNIEHYWAERGMHAHGLPSSFDLGTPPIGFAALAAAFGMPSARVERPEEIAPAIERALDTKGAFLIELVLKNEVASAVTTPNAGRLA